DQEGRFITINNACQKILGYKPEELIGESLLKFIHPDDRTKTSQERMNVITGSATKSFENRYIRKDGSTAYIIWSAYWSIDEKVTFGIAKDITEKKIIEEQFFRAQRLESIGTLASGIAHNLNNSIAPILISVDILKNILLDERSQRVIENVRTSALHATEMVNQVLNFAKGTFGVHKNFNLTYLLLEIEKVIFDTFPKNINSYFDIKKDLLNIKGDKNQIKQVLLNVLINSKYALSKGGKITLIAKNINIEQFDNKISLTLKKGLYILIEISDTGTGIAKEIIDKVFDPFFTTKSFNEGTGLGLSTSMSIIKSHDGFLEIYSESGNGTTVKIYLPALTNSESVQFYEFQKEITSTNKNLSLSVDS
ncbi:MAG: PAS domain S-box protein, partial [Candidatus Sericytochromatia bacterium]|nr:PAS domain S-box protein [Candidatus Sericytochromatia bacterium]